MPRVTVPTGGDSEPYIFVAVNGVDQSFIAGEPTDVTYQCLEVLGESHYAGELEVDDSIIDPWLFADFKNGVYTMDGTSVALEDIFTEDENWGTFDPEVDVIPGVGLKRTQVGYAPCPALVPANLALFLDNSTVVMNFVYTAADEGAGVNNLIIDHGDIVEFNDEWILNVRHIVEAPVVELTDYGSGNVQIPWTGDGPHRVAANFTSTRVAASIDGGAVDGFDNPSTEGLHTAVGITAGWTFVLEDIAFYPPQSDDNLAVLSTLPE